MKTKKMNGVVFIVVVLLVFILVAIVYNHSQLKKKGGKALDSDNLSLVNFKVDNCYVKCKRPEFVTFEEKMKMLQSAKEEEITREREIEIARVIADIKAEEERKRLAQEEAERKRKAELERQRLAKLAEQKKKEQSKTQIASRGSGYKANYEITHYTAFCPTGCTGKTASGYDVSNTIYYQGYRIVAAPPNIKFYTKLRITYQNGTVVDAIVLDRGGAIKGKPILDLLVSSKEEAYKLGRQKVKVEILH